MENKDMNDVVYVYPDEGERLTYIRADKLAKVREVLEFYAEDQNYEPEGVCCGHGDKNGECCGIPMPEIIIDVVRGEKAKQALAILDELGV